MIIPPKKITVAQTLAGKGAANAQFFEPHGCLQTVIDSPAPGFIRQVMLGSAGLQIRHHENWVVLPLNLILQLAEKLDPALIPPTPGEVAAAAAANARLVSPPAAPATPPGETAP